MIFNTPINLTTEVGCLLFRSRLNVKPLASIHNPKMMLPISLLFRVTGKMTSIICLVIFMVDAGCSLVRAQAPVPPGREMWGATLDVNVMQLRLQLNVEILPDGTVTGELLSPDQTSTPLILDQVIRTSDRLGFQIQRSGVSFEGTIDPTGQRASGQFQQQGQAIPLEFRKLDRELTQTHEASWFAEYRAINRVHRFQLRVFRDDEDKRTGKLDVFSEGAFGLPCDLQFEGSTVKLDCKILGVSFVGELDATGELMVGTWQQEGLQLPLSFSYLPLADSWEPRLNRPQNPQPPFPYQVREFVLPVRQIDLRFEPNVAMAGTLTAPEGEGPFPTVLLLSGTGAQNRDHAFLGHQPFAIIADHLTKLGYAVVRYDDRGVGQSVGPTNGATTISFANDAEAIYRWLKTVPLVDAQRIVLLGHSEGTMIASLLAMRQPDVAGVIMLAGHGVPGRRIVKSQTEAMARAQGFIPEFVESLMAFTDQSVTLAARGDEFNKLELEQLADTHFGRLSPVEKFDHGIHRIVDANFVLMQSPWMKFFFDYDPRPSLAYLRSPVLSLFGENDRQVVPEINAPEIEKAVLAGGNPDFQQHILPGLNHLFQPSLSGSSAEYIESEITLDESVLQMIADWLNQRFR